MNLKHVIETAILGASVLASGCTTPNYQAFPGSENPWMHEQRVYPREETTLDKAFDEPYHSRDYDGNKPKK